MKIKQLSGVLFLVFLSGCTSISKPTSVFIPAKQIDSPASIDAVKKKVNYNLSYGSDPALEQAFARYLKSGKAPNIVSKGCVSFAYSSDNAPIINTIPLQETVVSLQPGEKFTNISTGDPSRWSYAIATSGQGTLQQQNVLIKPSSPSISTNMVITTNKRIYNLRLVSGSSPDSHSSSNIVNTVADVSLNRLNFNYQLTCPRGYSMPNWKPTRVFDDGVHTYIQFPAMMASTDMPVLFVLRDTKNELVNYRYQSPYFVVDKIFKQAALILGVGRSQTRLIITNKMSAKDL
jgi:type IV secretion system protein TrbG